MHVVRSLYHRIQTILSHPIIDLLLRIINVKCFLHKFKHLCLAVLKLNLLADELFKNQIGDVTLVGFKSVEVYLFLVEQDTATNLHNIVDTFDLPFHCT